METPVLAALLNHQTADVRRDAQQRDRSSRPRESERTAVRPYVFITCAFEIEGDAPLFLFAEAVDD